MNPAKSLLIAFLMASTGFGQHADSLNLPSGPNQQGLKNTQPTASKFTGLPAMDLYAAIPLQGIGAGMGIGVFSKALILEESSRKNRLELRLGGDAYFVQYGYKNLGTMALASPQNGEAKITLNQHNFGFNAVARFSFVSEKARLSPYFDLFAGMRGFTTGMNIRPLNYQPGYEENTSRNLSTTTHLNYGASLGLLYAVNKNLSINSALMYSTSNVSGQIENIHAARIDGNAIRIDKTRTPMDFFVVKLGVTFLIEKSEPKSRNCCCNCDCCDRHDVDGIWFGRTNGSGSVLKSNEVNIQTRPSK